MASPNATYTELVTTTLENRRGRLTDNVENANVLLAWLKKRGNINLAAGGRTLVEELAYRENDTFAWYDGFELINIAPQQVFSAAEYTPKQYAGSVTISGAEMAMNSGREQMIPLMTSRIDNAEDSAMNGVAIAAYSNGSADGGKQLQGLLLNIANDPTSGTVGGIPRDQFAFWQNQFKDAATVFSNKTSGGVQALMREILLECVAAPGPQGARNAVDLIVAGTNAFDTFWGSLTEIQRITSASEGVAGFESVAFSGPGGKRPVFYDPVCGTNQMYFLSSRYMKYRPYRNRNFITSDERSSINQDAVVVLMLFMGNMTMSNAGRQGVIFD